MKSSRRVWLFAAPWTVPHQAPPSMGFSRQEYWSGVPFPSPGDLSDLGIEPRSPALQADSSPSEPPRKPFISILQIKIIHPFLFRSRYWIYSFMAMLGTWMGWAGTERKTVARNFSKEGTCTSFLSVFYVVELQMIHYDFLSHFWRLSPSLVICIGQPVHSFIIYWMHSW